MIWINSILRKSWDISEQADIDNREKIQALALAVDCYSMRLEIMTNCGLIDEASRFISEHKKQEVGKIYTESVVNLSPEIEKEEEDLESQTTNKTF
jgi:hypothetical protein